MRSLRCLPALSPHSLLPENKATLAKILTYHVVSGEVMAADVTDGDVATSRRPDRCAVDR